MHIFKVVFKIHINDYNDYRLSGFQRLSTMTTIGIPGAAGPGDHKNHPKKDQKIVGFGIIWKLSGIPAGVVSMPIWHTVTAYKAHLGPYPGEVDTFLGYDIKSLYGAINALKTRPRFLAL